MIQRARLTRRTLLAGSLLALAGCGAAPAATQTPAPPTVAPAPPTTAPPTAAPPTAAPPTAVPPTATSAPAVAPAATKPAAAAKAPEAAAPTKPAASGGSVPPELQQVAKAMAGLKSYTMSGTMTSKEQGKMEMIIEYVAPDRRRMEIKGATPDQSMGFVSIGPDAYMKMGPTWQKMPAGQAGNMDMFDTDWADRAGAAGTTMTPAGSETISGEPTTIYNFTDTDGAKGKMWISTRDSTIRKFDVMDNDGTEMSMLITNINQPITINPPA